VEPVKALFLDRDGVINVEQGYVHRRDEFRFQKGIFELCRAAQGLGYLLVVVTNQAGIARGYYTESEFLALTEWMVRRFAEEGVHIARVYHCPYHPVHGVGRYRHDSPDRKPKPGMLYRAQRDLNVDLTASVLVGDKLSDIAAAGAAGVGTKILLRPAGAEGVEGAKKEHWYVSGSLDEIRQQFFSSYA
jgi:D-glycero-D-manno-heptose 1,7-bisphosphate phosphatase